MADDVEEPEEPEESEETGEPELPKGKSEPLSGEITTNDKWGYMAELLAYKGIQKLGSDIGAKIKEITPPDARILIVYDLPAALELASLDIPLIQFQTQFDWFKNLLTTQKQRNKEILDLLADVKIFGLTSLGVSGLIAAIPPALTGISGALSTAADIIGYFRKNYDIQGQSFTIPAEALSAAVASTLNVDPGHPSDKRRMIYLLNFTLIDTSDVMKSLSDLINCYKDMEISKEQLKLRVASIDEDKKSHEVKIDGLNTRLEKLDPDKDQKVIKEIQNELEVETAGLKQLTIKDPVLDEAKSAIEESDSLSKVFGEYIVSVATAPAEGNTPSPIVQAAIRGQIKKQKITHVLRLKVLSSGGDATKEQSIWRSGRLIFFGGSVVTYILAKLGGEILATDLQIAAAQLEYRISRNINDQPHRYYDITFTSEEDNHKIINPYQ